jgi:membrane protease YdiL (CAAX protease family)
MPDWATFAGFAGVVLALLLLLARASQAPFRDDTDTRPSVDATTDGQPRDDRSGDRQRRDGPDIGHPARDDPAGGRQPVAASNGTPDRQPAGTRDGEKQTPVGVGTADRDDDSDGPGTADRDDDWTDEFHASTPELSSTALLVNVAASQALFGVVLLAGAWLTEIPLAAFGIAVPDLSAVGAGVALGVGLYVANEVGSAAIESAGLDRSERLRNALAPETATGWGALLLVVLPLIAVFEEFLFRGVLVGAFAVGFGVSPWLLAVLSSIAFALGHGAQGTTGVAVTGALGFVLAAAFVVTGSLLVVVVAHYLVNALEFLVHEWAAVDWA